MQNFLIGIVVLAIVILTWQIALGILVAVVIFKILNLLWRALLGLDT